MDCRSDSWHSIESWSDPKVFEKKPVHAPTPFVQKPTTPIKIRHRRGPAKPAVPDQRTIHRMKKCPRCGKPMVLLIDEPLGRLFICVECLEEKEVHFN